MATDLPGILGENLVGVYLWGSLTYDAFDESCSDVDCVGVTRRDIDDSEFSKLSEWFDDKKTKNRWTERLDMRFVIHNEFLSKTSRCCGFYHYTGQLVRHGSDGNPFIWMNIAQSGITLWGADGKLIAPHVSNQCLNDALRLELNYLKGDLSSNAGDRSNKAFVHNAYAVLTACRILYSAHHGALVSKAVACKWAIDAIPLEWRPAVEVAKVDRLKSEGSTTPQTEHDAMRFVEFATAEVTRILDNSSRTHAGC